MYDRNHYIARGEGRRRGRRIRRYELPLKFVANPRDYLVSRWGTPAFCWVAGDGNTPTVGPALTATGAPGSIAGPWELEDGTRLPLETYTGAEYRRNTTPLDPAADAVIAMVVRHPSSPAANERYLSTRNGVTGQGLLITGLNATQIWALVVSGGGTGTSTINITPGALNVIVMLWDSAARTVRLWAPGSVGVAGAVPAGGIVGGGIGLAADPSGLLPLGAGGAILAAAVYYGVGKAAEWAASTYARCQELLALATGLEPSGNQAPSKGRSTAARASAASWYDDDGRLWIASSGMMRAGDPGGGRVAPARTNKVYNNINPSATTGWSTTGGTHTVAADAAALATAKLECVGPNVHKFVPGASDQVLYGGAATGGTAAHSLSCYLRGEVGGEEVVIGLRDASSGAVQACATVTLTTGWVRYVIDGVTPADSDQQFALDCDAGDTVYAVLQQLEAGATSTTPIPNWATGAGAARAATTIDPPVTPRDSRGRVTCGVTPLGYSGAVTGGNAIIARTTGGSVLGTDDATDDYTTSDGTTEVKAGAVATGTRAVCAVDWAGATQRLTVDGTEATAAYDGAVAGSGTYRLQASGGEVAVDSLVIEEAA